MLTIGDLPLIYAVVVLVERIPVASTKHSSCPVDSERDVIRGFNILRSGLIRVCDLLKRIESNSKGR